MIDMNLEKYIEGHNSPEDEILAELNRETNLKALFPRMLSGHVLGKFLEMVGFMVRPNRILEIGTYTGYATICLAKALAEKGLIHTIELNPELDYISTKYFKKSNVEDKIVKYTGNALEIIPAIDEMFELVFIDADKENYLNYYQLVFDKVRKGGIILADNALWDGKVLNQVGNSDKETKGIIDFNDFVQQDDRVENILIPLRDGVMMIRKF